MPAFFLGTVREKTDQALGFSVAVHDLAGAPLLRESTPSGGAYRYDVRSMDPVLKRDYRVELSEGRNWLTSEIGTNKTLSEHRREISEQFALRMTNVALEDTVRGLRF